MRAPPNPNRPISVEERMLIEWLLDSVPLPKRSAYLSQIDELRITYHCDCGCPTVGFGPRPTKEPSTILAEAYGPVPEGLTVDIILWQNEGRLSGIEYVSHVDQTTFSVPEPGRLTRMQVLRDPVRHER
jgi:hypothetical protein